MPLYCSDCSRGWPEGSFFNSYYMDVWGGHYSFPWIAPLYPSYISVCRVLSKEVWSTILLVFRMTWPRIESRSPGPLANTLPTWLISWKGMNLSVLQPANWQIAGQTDSLTMVKQPVSRKENWIQTSFTLLKNWPCVTSCLWRILWVNTYMGKER